jgi:hypothetical protein
MSEWSVDTLKEYLDTKFRERDLRYQQRFDASERRLDGMNEFRAALNDAQKTYITRTEAMAAIDRNAEDIKQVTDRVNTSEGRGRGLKDGWGWLIGIIGLGIALFVALHR